MAKDAVVFTSSWAKSKKTGLYPSHVIDTVSYVNWEKINNSIGMSTWCSQYTKTLSANTRYPGFFITWAPVDVFKKEHSPTGQRKYKRPLP